jgi:hypothetical protein
MKLPEKSFTVSLDFEPIKFPPVDDILILGKKLPQGRNGMLHSFQLISPDTFELIDINEDDNIDAVIINKAILRKLPKEKVLSILKEHVFPFISKGESVKVNFNIRIYQKNIVGDINVDQNANHH